MSLLWAELRKVWAGRALPLLLAALAAADLLLLWLRPAGDTPAPAALRAVTAAMDGMDMPQRGGFLRSELARTQALLQLEGYYRQLAWGGFDGYGWRQRHAELLAEYDEAYRAGAYTLYSADLDADRRLLAGLLKEYETVGDHGAFLQSVQQNAARLSGISIFQRGGYDLKSIQRTAAAYAGLEAVEIDWWPQAGLMTALEYPFTDLLCLAAMLGLALALVRRERDAGLLALIRCTPGGRLRTALAKLCAFALSLAAVTALLYGVNLAWCAGCYGLGPLGRSIQSVPALMRCTMRISVGRYLARFLLAKWAGALVMGLWVMLAALAARRAAGALAAALALPLAMFGVRAAIPAASRLNVLKYANLASLLQTDELLGAYRNLYWFGEPVSLPAVEWCAAVIYGTALAAAFCLVFCRVPLRGAPARGAGIPVRRRTRATGVWRAEAYKLLVVCGAGLCLPALAALGVRQAAQAPAYVSGEETLLAAYVKPISGPWSEESRAFLLEQGREFAELERTQQRVGAGLLPQQALDRFWELGYKYDVYRQVVADRVNGYLAAHPGAWVVYDTGWRALFGLDGGRADVQEALLAGLACALCFGGLFAMERRAGMEALLRTTPRGRGQTARAKLGTAALAAVSIAALAGAPRLYTTLCRYGLPAPLAPAMSLADFAVLPAAVTLSDILLLRFLCRAAACLCMGAFTLWLGRRLGGALPAAFASAVLYCLPALLALAGLDTGIEWLGPAPWFRAPALAAELPWLPPLLLAAALLIAAALAQSLCAAYEG